MDGSLGWTRTNDQRINSPTLYQLSYQGTESKPAVGALRQTARPARGVNSQGRGSERQGTGELLLWPRAGSLGYRRQDP